MSVIRTALNISSVLIGVTTIWLNVLVKFLGTENMEKKQLQVGKIPFGNTRKIGFRNTAT